MSERSTCRYCRKAVKKGHLFCSDQCHVEWVRTIAKGKPVLRVIKGGK